MPLSADQRAILELLHERGLSHEEIDDLLGAEPGEARRRERAALEAMSEEEAAEFPAARRPEAASGGRLPRWGRIGVAVLAAVAVGLGAGALVRGGSEEPSERVPTATEEAPRPVHVALEPTAAGGEARGEAVIALDDRFEPVLDLDLAELPPAPRGSTYVPWIDLDGERGLPVPSPIAVEDGAFRDRIELAPQLISVFDVARALEIVPLDRAGLEELSREVEAGGGGAGSRGVALRRPGEAVLSGRIPGR